MRISDRFFFLSVSFRIRGTPRLTLYDPPVQMIDPDDPVAPTRIDVLPAGTLDRAKVTPDQGREDVVSAVGHNGAVERVGLVPRFTVVAAPARRPSPYMSARRAFEVQERVRGVLAGSPNRYPTRKPSWRSEPTR